MSTPARIVSLALLTLSAGALVVGPLAESASATTASGSYESSVVKNANSQRHKYDRHKVKKSNCLKDFAQAQAQAMAAAKSMYHQPMGPILDKCNLSQVGENVAFGYADGAAVTSAWMNSPGHRSNLLNKKHRLIGVGAAQDSDGYWYVSQVFGKKM